MIAIKKSSDTKRIFSKAHFMYYPHNEDFKSKQLYPFYFLSKFLSFLFWNIKKVPIFAPLLAKERDVAQSG